MKQSFKEKQERVLGVVNQQMESQGVDTQAHEEQIGKLVQAFMLVEQCLWYRIEDTNKVEKLIKSYEDLMEDTMDLLSKYNFEDLVYTYRSNFTNLYTYKLNGEKRWYKLSKKDYESFLEKVKNGKLQVVSKQKSQKKKTQKTNQTNKLAAIIENNSSKKVESKTQEKPKENVESKTQKTTKWEKITTKDLPKKAKDGEKLRLKIETKKHKSKIYDTFQGIAKFANDYSIIVGKTKNKSQIIDLKDIKNVWYKKVELKTQESESKTQEKESKKVESKTQKKKQNKATRKGWVEKPLNEEIKEKTFIKVKMQDKSNKFVRYMDSRQDKQDIYLLVDDHGKPSEIKASEISKVYTYVK